ncbi:MAG: response regulator [Bacteroidales bacterium]|nr:response regulator [Bacteroidales bacterium]
MMPGMDGYELCRKIKSLEKFKDVPVIFISAKNEIEDTLEGFAAGAADFITKPFDSRILISRIITHLELKLRSRGIEQTNQFLEDIVKERTEELRVAHEELLQLDLVKSEFLNIISHEIRTPLNGIMGASQLLMRRNDPKVAVLFEVLNSSVTRLEKFLMNALLITSLKLKRHEFHIQPIDLKVVVENELKTDRRSMKLKT